MDSDTTPPFPRVGAIVTFTCSAASMALRLPQQEPGEPLHCYVGKVTKVAPMKPYGPGKIPTAAVTVQGRTGLFVVVDGVAVDLMDWPSWGAAQEAAARFNHSQ